MKVLSRAALIAFALFACALPAQAMAAGTGLDAYDVKAIAEEFSSSSGSEGFDVTEARHGNHIEIVATRGQAAALARDGITAKLKRDRQGRTVRQRFDALPTPTAHTRLPPVLGPDLRRPRGPQRRHEPAAPDALPGADRARGRAPRHRQVGDASARRVNGAPILALKVTKNARTTPDGQRPAVLYSANQHAREWITAESDRRMVAHVRRQLLERRRHVARQGPQRRRHRRRGRRPDQGRAHEDRQRQRAVVRRRRQPGRLRLHVHRRQPPVAQEPARQQRRRRRSPPIDGVDPNRNYPTKWGYDNEGSSDDPPSETYRGTGPDVRARDQGAGRPDASASASSSRSTTTPPPSCCCTRWAGSRRPTRADDPIYRALSGTRRRLGDQGPGRRRSGLYDPDVSAELYITNGETTDHAHAKYGTLAWTPEMDVADPARGGGDSRLRVPGLRRPTSRTRSRRTSRSRSTSRRSAKDPAEPGLPPRQRRRPTSRSSTFGISYGDPQTVQVDAKRELGDVTHALPRQQRHGADRVHRRVEGRQRYGSDSDIYYHRMRGIVKGTKPGDEVRGVVHRRRQEVASVHLHGGERLKATGADHGRRGLLRQAGER